MSLEEFLERIKAEFEEDYDIGDVSPDDNIKEMDWWSSMHALVIIALVDSEFDVMLEPAQMRSVDTVRELYDLVNELRD